jgi:plasmid stabilization system protein ParE
VVEGPAIASAFEDSLFEALDGIARLNGAGHRRRDLTERDLFFHLFASYFIIFERRASELRVIRILHAARDLRKLL